ncbi:hypothetical protein [[Mycoplasma] gypis]|uniref:Spermidine/putrescine-binding periplasmic protein n=1 Tax=[Mycoplasma] gypis TaxID=92404 RepID=A0ABZ2RRB1_9BACT|nr:hypothetical protein [[Mycoplasma] gypis]MBN0919123.1 hypothetical protein [[Mycoplasma] gypis]
MKKLIDFLKRLKSVLISLLVCLFVGLLVLLAFTFKSNHGFKPSVYNYGSYLSPKIIQKIKTNYNYKVFNDINEFSVAINNKKTVGGVGSDFQTAQLIIEDKLKKFDFTTLFDTDKNTNLIDQLKQIYLPNVITHLQEYDNKILNIIKKQYPDKLLNNTEYDIDGDKKPDHFWEYIIPYYIQDKVIAYNVNKEFRPYLKLTEDEIENGIEFKDNSWETIIKTLKQHNYRVFAWNNAYYDNMMIGAFYNDYKKPGSWLDKNQNLKPFDEQNYESAIKGFESFVKDETGFDLKNTKRNFLIGDGLELANSVIEPRLERADVAVMYNGDAIDAYYSSDNFANAPDGYIRFIRPKNNFLLMDGWIQTKELTDQQSLEFTKVIAENIYPNISVKNPYQKRYFNLEKGFILEVANYFKENGFESKNTELQNSINSWTTQILQTQDDTEIQKLIDQFYQLYMDNEDEISEYLSEIFFDSENSQIINFDYINYTPIIKEVYDFIKKWYFGSDEFAIQLFEQPEPSTEYKTHLYQIIDSKLRTKISKYYYELTKS